MDDHISLFLFRPRFHPTSIFKAMKKIYTIGTIGTSGHHIGKRNHLSLFFTLFSTMGILSFASHPPNPKKEKEENKGGSKQNK